MSKGKPCEEELSFECELSESPEQVWRALTEPELLAAWLMPNDFRAEVGASFSFQPSNGDGESVAVDCTVLELVPQQRLRFSWHERREGAPKTSVSFQLTPSDSGGTHLRLIHAQTKHSALGQLLFLPVHTSRSRPTSRMRCAA